MSVGFRTGNFHYIVGTSAFLHAYFSTVSGRLEPAGWGSRFPALISATGRCIAAFGDYPEDELRAAAPELSGIRVGWRCTTAGLCSNRLYQDASSRPQPPVDSSS